ncbi:MAG TPA: hypothetical protein VEQ63_11620, partial [Bryobacteraceae bacterium]|nr:hypothetical protein [Bryobacteraceae bacterium]
MRLLTSVVKLYNGAGLVECAREVGSVSAALGLRAGEIVTLHGHIVRLPTGHYSSEGGRQAACAIV